MKKYFDILDSLDAKYSDYLFDRDIIFDYYKDDGIITVELNMNHFRVYDDATMELFKNEFNKLIK